MKKFVLFDLDGTLLNTLDDIADSANFALSRCGYPVHATEAYKYFVGNGVDKLIERILPEDTKNPDAASRLKEIYVRRYDAHSMDRTRPYDGIAGLLRELNGLGVRTAVISNKPDEPTKTTISHYFGDAVFDVVMGATSEFPLKPDPAIVNHVLRLLGASAEEAIFVGDTKMDMRTAKNARCGAVGVTWGFRPKRELLENGADRIIDSPQDLLSLL
jgi:phosphoglycolate phosphatase